MKRYNKVGSIEFPAKERRRAMNHGLSIGQLSAFCTNMSRACEKQYKTRESELFAELAEHFAEIEEPIANADVDNVAAVMKWDLGTYPEVRAIVDADHDRGAARALTWGEKVSNMLSSLVERYQKEGESLVAGTQVWVCTACGFVYIGDAPPEICPVCKVPDWKFEKIEGRA